MYHQEFEFDEEFLELEDVKPILHMQTSSIELPDAPFAASQTTFAGTNGLNNSAATLATSASNGNAIRIGDGRSHSRSTDGTDTSDGGRSDVVPCSAVSSPNEPVMNLHHALQNTLDSNTFASSINQSDFYNFQNNSFLNYQMLTQIGKAPTFDQKPDVGVLQQQMQMREAKPYKCTQCVKSFANSSYLSQHMRIHLGIKPFGPCQYCGKKFTQLSHLQQHIRTHTGEKPYKCKFTGCEKAFSQLSNLQSHSRCHQTDKPYKCNSCYKCFTDETSLLEHIPKHKESKHLKVHICPFCGKSYTQHTYLQKHMTKHADRSRTTGIPGFRGTEIGTAEAFDPAIFGNWNMPGIHENAHDNQFALANSMMGAVSGSHASYANPALHNSAFTQLLNFRKGPGGYFDYPAVSGATKAAERAPGFNMITPLENIQRYSGSSATSATAAAVVASGNGVHPSQFNPQSLISNMKQHTSSY